jgi:hypothetical protein
MTATSAEVRFATTGVAKVGSHLHLTGSTGIYCFTSDDHSPVLAIYDGHVEVSITVPDPARVTAEDVTCARMLAEAVARYVAELEQLAGTGHRAESDAAGAGGVMTMLIESGRLELVPPAAPVFPPVPGTKEVTMLCAVS